MNNNITNEIDELYKYLNNDMDLYEQIECYKETLDKIYNMAGIEED